MDYAAAVAALSADFALAIQLEDAGSGHEVIAQRLGIDVQAVGPMLIIARKKLRRLLAETDPAADPPPKGRDSADMRKAAGTDQAIGSRVTSTTHPGEPTPVPVGIGPVSAADPSLHLVLRRADDQLVLRFTFWNLVLDKGSSDGQAPRLVRAHPAKPASVAINVGPQHMLEQAIYQEDPHPVLDPDAHDPTGASVLVEPPVGARIAGDSRLVFDLPESVAAIPYTVAGLLNWAAWRLSVVPLAVAPGGTPPQATTAWHTRAAVPIQQPNARQTALELPWWLVLSPPRASEWSHAIGAVEHAGRVELWHSRLTGHQGITWVGAGDPSRPSVRAVWARDPQLGQFDFEHTAHADPDDIAVADGLDLGAAGMPFLASMSPRDRRDLIISSTDFRHVFTGSGYQPQPAWVDRLMLSSMGAWADIHGTWRAGPGADQSRTSLQSWRHVVTMGRDQYVRIVRTGFLFPFGHVVSLVRVTERRFRTVASGDADPRRIAYLFQRYFLVVGDPEVGYGGASHPRDGRAWPFTRVRLTTLSTPTLGIPEPEVASFDAPSVFVPRVAGAPFLFHAEATDRAGRHVSLAVPAVFVDGILATDSDKMSELRDWYNATSAGGPATTDPVRVVDLRGQKIAPAPPSAPGNTDVEMHRLTLGAEAPTAGGSPMTSAQLAHAGRPGFLPTMSEATIRLAAAEAVRGGSLGDAPVVVLDPAWIDDDFAAGPGEVFLRFKDTGAPTALSFNDSATDKSGGLVAPNMGITALSRKTGNVAGDPAAHQSGHIDPAEFFKGMTANLLGDLQLMDVIDTVTAGEFDSGKVLRLSSHQETGAIVTELDWHPSLHDFGPFHVDPAGGTSLDVTARLRTPTQAGAPATSVVIGDLQHFTIGLLVDPAWLNITFDRLRFRAETGKKTDVDVQIRDVVFAGELSFINDLKDYLAFDSGGFAIALKPTHLEATFQLPLPTIAVGVFSLQSLTFAAGVTIPFTGEPVRFRFGFNSQDNPFLISVMIFGGGGFFELGIGTDGVESFQMSLEFGVMAALDFGVASGSVSVTAGIYLAVGVASDDNPDGNFQLTGFIKIKGELEVLGLITASILMSAELSYLATGIGLVRATIVIEVDVFVFHGSVEIEYEKKFGGGSDPDFAAALSEQHWSTYLAAFAPIGA